MQYRDYYETLGVARDAPADEIKRAWRKLARKFHPDVSKETNADARMREINEAYEVLGDAEKRAAYDKLGRGPAPGQEFRPPPGWGSGEQFHSGGGPDDEAAFSDFFESLFGASRRGAPRGAPEGAREFAMPGRDRHAVVEIDLEDTFNGATRELTLRTPEIDAAGHVTERERVLQVTIPRGVRAGQQIRLAGQGEPGIGGAPNGSLYLEVQFRPHRLFKVDGRDLYLTLPVAPWEAALGAEVRAPTPGGAVDLQVPPNTASGRKLRLKERGIPGQPPGDFYAIIEIALPPADSEKSRELYRTMERELPFNPRRHLGV
ncbi:MAG: DnaJ C-terminal domain-containing protein [Burkholderiaceae bacterium]